jgi:hypothetical protein
MNEVRAMEILREWWPVIMATLGGVLWLSRLEWRGLQNEAEIKRLWTQRKEDLASAQKARDDTNKLLEEMRADIKQILARGVGR